MDAQHQHGEQPGEKNSEGGPSGGRLPELGPLGLLRWAWRQLTSMRTALFLLLLVAVAAVPGSIFPQRNLDPARVADYLRDHPDTGPWLDRFGFFGVFSSPWFSAIYLLLMLSLIGCVVPRTKLHVQAIRHPPPRAPRRMERLPSHHEGVIDGEPEAVLAQARRALGWRYRFRCGQDDDPNTLSAETGYSRETGNLLFHIALLVLIVALAWGHLVGWRGDRIVPVGQSFSNSVSGYDTFNPGPWVNAEDLPPFTVRIDALDVRFESDPRAGKQVGAPRDFRARTSVTEGPGQPMQPRELSVNGPLGFGDTQVYLLGNGYAPTITVRDAAGQVLFRQQVPFLPQDDNYTSTGAVKVTGAQPKQLGLMGLLLPTAAADVNGGLRSTFPGATNPALVLTAYEGELFPEGRAQSVYTVDTTRMSPVKGEDGSQVRLTLTPGQSAELPGGRGSVTFDQLDRWAGVSARYDPARPLALMSSLVAALGLVASLLVRRRRIFVRVHTEPVGADGRRRTRMEVAGLAKGDDPKLDVVVADLVRQVDERQAKQVLSAGSGR
ncbi:cytochrome c biogenesis protein ResB [Austwickia chelonae]|uniref:cytochrome c biogenesis protein ResB n=1 Tax=Austwickia chelonae TaxID=100225 RepID=UPI000E233B21|nr:cytochrome c biogenesis protein ResB [Austwickia chelonae]